MNLDIAQRNVVWTSVLNGFAGPLMFVPLTTTAMGTLGREQMGQGTGIFNLMRNIGASVGIATVTTLLTRGTQAHQARLVGHLTPYDPEYQRWLEDARARLAPQVGSAAAGPPRSGSCTGRWCGRRPCCPSWIRSGCWRSWRCRASRSSCCSGAFARGPLPPSSTERPAPGPAYRAASLRFDDAPLFSRVCPWARMGAPCSSFSRSCRAHAHPEGGHDEAKRVAHDAIRRAGCRRRGGPDGHGRRRRRRPRRPSPSTRPIEADDLKKYAARFNEDHPDIEIKWVRDSTGVVTAKLLAEKANPQADVIWGLAATSLLVLKPEGMLLPYTPKGVEKLDPQFRDKENPPAWVGMDAWVAAICFNTAEAAKKNLPKPTSWKDLTKPVYKGQVVMPNPASSGTGFLDVSSWLQLFGEAEGWKYMDALHQNIGVYTHSGSKPCTMAGQGEYPIGVAFEFRAARVKKQGAPIDIVFPEEKSGWDMEATAIVKGTKNLEAAKTLVDWSVSEKAMKLYNEGYAVTAIPSIAQPVEHLPANMLQHMAKNDFQWAATNRARILAEWEKRYGAKSEPKK